MDKESFRQGWVQQPFFTPFLFQSCEIRLGRRANQMGCFCFPAGDFGLWSLAGPGGGGRSCVLCTGTRARTAQRRRTGSQLHAGWRRKRVLYLRHKNRMWAEKPTSQPTSCFFNRFSVPYCRFAQALYPRRGTAVSAYSRRAASQLQAFLYFTSLRIPQQALSPSLRQTGTSTPFSRRAWPGPWR